MDGRSIKALLMGGMDIAESGAALTSTSCTPMYEVYKLVGNNVYPNVVPQNYGTPALVYTVTDTSPYQVKGQSTPATTIDLEVDVLGDSYADIIKISTYLISNLHRFHNTYNNNDLSIGGTLKRFGAPYLPINNVHYGYQTPISSESVQFWGGASIISLFLVNAIEGYDDKLELYRNTLNFKITYLNNASTSGAIYEFDFNNLYTIKGYNSAIPASINDLIFRLNSIAISPERSGYHPYKNYYALFANSGGIFIKKNAEGNNYAQFDENDYLLGNPAGLNETKYSEITTFFVTSLPNALTSDLSASLIGGATTSSNKGLIWLETDHTSIPNFSTYAIKVRLKLESGVYDYTVVTLLQSIPLSFFPDLDWSKELYFALSLKYVSSTEIKINWELINGSNPTDILYLGYNYKEITLTDTDSGGNYSDELFCFESLHDTSKGDPINIYEFSFFDKALDFGSPQYLEVRDYTIDKHKLITIN